MSISLVITFLSLFTQAKNDGAEMMLRLATADQPLVHSAVVDAPVKKVWDAYTSTSGITSWMVPKGEVVLKIGGHIRTSYSKDSNLTGPEVIESAILSFDPERMITIKCTKTPEGFPFKKAMDNVWTVLYFQPVTPEKTEVTCRMIGFDHTEDSAKLKAFFKRNNQVELDALIKHFTVKRD